MTRQATDLLDRLMRLELDEPDVALPFSARLAKENGWSPSYARRVIREYKRFVYLSCVAEHVVSPSEDVDQAWHLHLTYTRSYWDGLCKQVLERPLHHEPTRGGDGDGRKYRGLYEQTLASYQQAFGEAPPADIWPPVEVRFGEDLKYRRVNAARYWFVPRPRLHDWARRFSERRRRAAAVALAAVPVVCGATNPLNLTGPEFMWFFGVMLVAGIVAAIVLRRMLRDVGGPVEDVAVLDAYQVACLSGGKMKAVMAALARLLQDGSVKIVVPPKKFFTLTRPEPLLEIAGPLRADAPTMERSIYRAIEETPGACNMAAVFRGTQSAANGVLESLQARGLLQMGKAYRWLPAAVMTAIFLLGVTKIIVGVMRERPVGYLVFACVVAFFAALFCLAPAFRSRTGDALLATLTERYRGLQHRPAEPLATADAAMVPMAFALFGAAALSSGIDEELKAAMTAPSLAQYRASLGGSSSGCGGGCGGGGCGGGGCGGGGCGGCGGGD